ncbi:MAG: hypothetical protein BGN89_15240 [Alphaproteobacteria bacterium 64-6]|nr:MAG: hypothetical protein BGN89_15240 [Alphaproteobacteria bacterium 64-6]
MPIQKPIEEVKEEKEEVKKPIEKVEVKEEKKDEKPKIEEAKPQEAMVQQGAPPAPTSTPAPQTAARRQGTTDRPSDEAMSWSKALMNHLGRHRRYPTQARQAGQQGAVHVRFCHQSQRAGSFSPDYKGLTEHASRCRGSGHAQARVSTARVA